MALSLIVQSRLRSSHLPRSWGSESSGYESRESLQAATQERARKERAEWQHIRESQRNAHWSS